MLSRKRDFSGTKYNSMTVFMTNFHSWVCDFRSKWRIGIHTYSKTKHIHKFRERDVLREIYRQTDRRTCRRTDKVSHPGQNSWHDNVPVSFAYQQVYFILQFNEQWKVKSSGKLGANPHQQMKVLLFVFKRNIIY